MVTSLNRGTPAREAGYEMGQYCCARVAAVAGGATQLSKIGKIPAGAIITAVHSKVTTAITGGTPVLSVGTFADPGNDDLVATMAEAAGSELLQPLAAFVQPLVADTEFYAAISGGATAGEAYVTIAFIKPLA